MIFIPCHTFLCYTLGKSQRYHRDSALLTLNQKTQLFSAESWTDALTDTPISLQMLFSSSFFLFISFSFLLVLFFSISVKTLSLLCLFDNVTAPWACLFFSTWILSALQVYSHDSVPCLFSFHSFDYWLPIFFFLKHKATHSFSAMSIQVDGTMCYRNGHHHYQQHQRPFKRFFIQIILFVYIFETSSHCPNFLFECGLHVTQQHTAIVTEGEQQGADQCCTCGLSIPGCSLWGTGRPPACKVRTRDSGSGNCSPPQTSPPHTLQQEEHKIQLTHIQSWKLGSSAFLLYVILKMGRSLVIK